PDARDAAALPVGGGVRGYLFLYPNKISQYIGLYKAISIYSSPCIRGGEEGYEVRRINFFFRFLPSLLPPLTPPKIGGE
ncbi:MAG: hypothetical protein AAB968_04650, partial [Patescibacteria group bacterium]